MDTLNLTAAPPITPGDATEIEWRAAHDDLARHAFPRRDGFPARSICGIRWTAAFGSHGNAWCLDCMAGLREALAAYSKALAIAEARDLAAGDHHVGVGR